MVFEIFKRAIKDKFMGALIAAALLFVYIFFLATFYPQMETMGDVYTQMMQNPTFKALLGDEMFALTTFSGFMGVEVFSYMGIVLGAYIVFLTASFVAGEIEQKTSDLLLSLPVSRVYVVLSRFLALIPLVILVMLGMLTALYAGAWYINEEVQIEWFALALLFMGVFTLAVGAASLFLSALMSDGKRAAFISIGVLLAMYLVESIGAMVTSIDWARRLSLFHYLKVNTIAVTHTINWNNMAVLLAVTVVFLVLAVLAFRQRDINVS
jgi:ABC-2 type transport system permease protein